MQQCEPGGFNGYWHFPATVRSHIFSRHGVLLISYALLGFWKCYFAVGLISASLPSLLVHVHAVLFAGWLTLLMAQNAFVASGNVAIHRKLGALMAAWAAAIVLIGPATVIMAVRRPHSGVNAGALAGDLAQTIAFAILFVTGFVRRHNGPAHKRLMTLASAAIIGPAIIRWQLGFIQQEPPFGVLLAYLLPPLIVVIYDLATLRRIHHATWLGLGLMVAVLMSFSLLPLWPGWLDFTQWLQQT